MIQCGHRIMGLVLATASVSRWARGWFGGTTRSEAVSQGVAVLESLQQVISTHKLILSWRANLLSFVGATASSPNRTQRLPALTV